MKINHGPCQWLMALSLLCFGSGVRAQTFSGTVLGHVADLQQATIAGASVILHSVERNFERRTNTNTNGEFNFQLVPPGKFTLTVEKFGFASTTVSLEVVVATPVRADVILGLRSLQQIVRVVGEDGVSVQTENANLGVTVSPREMSELPSLTRSPYDFIALMAGAVLSNDAIGVGFAVNGGRTQSANYLLDGAENNDSFMSAPGQDVPLDSIEEFKVQTNLYSAEYGRNSGFTANIVTKAGTNDLHGSLYEFNRNSALAANTFENNAHGLSRPVFNRNQFGGNVGGAFRQKRLFYFTSLEPIMVRSSGPNTFYVPTPQLLAASAPGIQAIFQRFPLPEYLSSTNVFNRPICPFGSNCNPATGAGFVDLPAFAFTSRTGPQDAGAGPPQNTVLATGRVDWIVNSKMQAFFRYAFENKDEFATTAQPYSKKLDVPISARNQNVALNLIRIWSPRIATESRMVYSRVVGDPDRFGGDNPSAPQPPIPDFFIQNEANVVLPFGTAASEGPQNFYQFFQTLSLVRDHHTLKVGGQFVHLRENIHLGIGVGEVADASFLNVQGFVDGVLGFYSIAINPKGVLPGGFVGPPFEQPSFRRHYRYNEPAVFITDTWKITPRVSLTPGLRWEYFGPLHSPGTEHALDSNFFPGAGNSLEEIATGRFLRTVDAPGPLRGRFYRPSYANFAPRLGLAIDPFGDGKTAIRAGGGIFYDRHVGWELFRVFLNPPSYSLTVLKDIPVTPSLLANQYAVFPNSAIQLDQSDTTSIDPNMRTAYTSSWNVTVEHEFAERFVTDVSYLGSSGSRLYSTFRPDRMGSGGLLDASCVTTRFASDGSTPLGPDFTNCPGLNSNISDLRVRSNGSHSSFESLQVRLDSRRLPRWGAEFGINYTWSHSIDNRSVSALSGSIADSGAAFLDAFNPSLDRGSSDFDVRHRVAAHFIWELPFGRDISKKRHFIFGGWEISGLLSYQTGQPFTLGDLGVPDLRGERTRPRLTGIPPPSSPLVPDALSPNSFLYLAVNQVYDPVSGGCLAEAKPFACQISVNGPFGDTLPRNSFRQPGAYYQDTALLKNITLPKENLKLQFRAEFYNLFNHPNLYVNGGSLDVSAQTFSRNGGPPTPGVTASFKDNRQIVLALKMMF